MKLVSNKADEFQSVEELRLLSLAIHETDRALLILDSNRRIIFTNRAFTELFDYTLPEILGRRLSEFLVGPNTDVATLQRIPQQTWEDRGFQEETLFYSKSGREIWSSGSINPIHDDEGNLINLVVILADITDARHIQTLQHIVLEAVASGLSLVEVADLICRNVELIAPEVISTILLVDEDKRLHSLASPSLPDHFSSSLNGLSIGESAGSCGAAAYLGEPVCAVDIETDPRWEPYKFLALPLGIHACWSSPIKMRDGHVAGTFAFYYREKRAPSTLHKELVHACLHLCALAIERDDANQKIAQLSHFDTLTGLPNRNSLYERAGSLLSRMHGEEVSFFSLDLDLFKDVNNTLGHPTGDRILIEAAYRLQKLSQPTGIISRTAGDAFVLVIPDCNVSQASAMADKILETLRAPIQIHGISLSISASIGISVIQDKAITPEVATEQAVTAMHQAKSAGRACYHFYSSEMNKLAQDRLVLGAALRDALATSSLRLEYQPQLQLDTMKLTGVEALSRWTDDRLGNISPGKFIPLAEEIGQIEAIGHWSLREACRQMAAWRKHQIPIPSVSVNLSPLHFRSRHLPEFVDALLKEYDLPPICLTIEITEGAMMNQHPESLDIARALHHIGVGLSIDDFGTGFSSLARLTRLPITELKLDRSFMRDFENDSGAQAVANAVISLGRNLGITVVSEGVETEAQAKLLMHLGCNIAQGYLYGKSMSAKNLESWIASRNPAN